MPIWFRLKRAAGEGAGVDVDVVEGRVVAQVLHVVVGHERGMLKTSPVRSVPLSTLLLSRESWARVKVLLLAVSSPPELTAM